MARGVVTNIQGLAAMCPQGNGFPPAISNVLATLTAHRLRYLFIYLLQGMDIHLTFRDYNAQTAVQNQEYDLAVRFASYNGANVHTDQCRICRGNSTG
jgi:urate oxidase